MGTPIHFTPRSSNRKIGPIPATTLGRQSCPTVCAFYGNGCYGEDFYTQMHWDKVTRGERDLGLEAVCDRIAALPSDQIWRHAVTGDVTPGGVDVDQALLGALVQANAGRPVIGYTHADVLGNTRNRDRIESANDAGFTLNLSGNNLTHADRLADLEIAPVVVALPKGAPTRLQTPQGRAIVVCPATYMEDKNCANCGLCARQDRAMIVGFPAHGTRWKKVDFVARQA